MRNNGGAIELALNGTVSTRGDNASGQIVQSIGAGGGEAYLTGIDHAQLTLGARDGSTGDGGDILVDNSGDITFRGFENGTLFLHMKGACSGCPSSTATLKHGIQNLLRHFVPEVQQVEQI